MLLLVYLILLKIRRSEINSRKSLMNKSQIFKLIVSLTLPLGLGAIAGMFTSKAVPVWYATLNRPSFNPPGWVFGPVWTTLYILLGISLFLIWKLSASKERNLAIFIFLVQQALNFGWSFIVFYLTNDKIFYGTNEIPYGSVYAIGYSIVESFKKNNPEIKDDELINISPERILLSSNFDK